MSEELKMENQDLDNDDQNIDNEDQNIDNDDQNLGEEELSEEQLTKAKEALIAKGEVVDYETRFKPIYGSLKHTERELDQIKSQKPQPKQENLGLGPKPKSSDFEDYDQYLDARDEWIEKKTEIKLKEQGQISEKQNLQQKMTEQVAAAVAKDPEFLDKGYIPVPLESVIAGTDFLADFAYYFAENPTEANRLAGLISTNPNQVSREIGRMEAKFENKPPPSRTQTKAPNPTAQSKGGKTATKKDVSEMTMEEYAEWRRANS
jgi:hypothetical protein